MSFQRLGIQQILPALYDVKAAERLTWSRYWCGPDRFEHGQATKVAVIEKVERDGYDVEIWTTAMPARFHRLVARPSRDGAGQVRSGFVMTFGTLDIGWLRGFAAMVTEGLVGCPVEWEPGAELPPEHNANYYVQALAMVRAAADRLKDTDPDFAMVCVDVLRRAGVRPEPEKAPPTTPGLFTPTPGQRGRDGAP